MSYLVTLPFIWPPYQEECLKTMSTDLMNNLLLIDNTELNRGIAGSWNVGMRHVVEQKLDWFIGLSAAVRFGEPGGDDFIEHLEMASGDEWAIEGGDYSQPNAKGEYWGLAWHLIAFPRRTIETVGYLDENFWPRDFDDLDYSYRIQCAAEREFPPRTQLWPKVPVDAWSESTAHSITLAGVHGNPRALAYYYTRKWGGLSGHERHRTPFGRDVPLSYWPAPDPH